MIYQKTSNKNIHGDIGEFKVIQYLTSDVPDKYQKYLYKECKVDDYDGIIIGIEDNEVFDDEYFIIYIPKTSNVAYVLVIDADFYSTIKD